MQGMYKASKKRFDDDAEFKERARRAVTLLQRGDPDFIKAWERICEASRKVSSLLDRRQVPSLCNKRHC